MFICFLLVLLTRGSVSQKLKKVAVLTVQAIMLVAYQPLHVIAIRPANHYLLDLDTHFFIMLSTIQST